MPLKSQLNLTGRGLLLCATLAIALVASLATQAGGAVYWVNGNSIGRMNLDGTNPSPGLIFSYSSPIEVPCGLAVDDSHIFWADRGGNVIGRANLEGGDQKYDFITGADEPCGVVVDDTHIYWANRGGDSIGRARLDGTEVEQKFIPGVAKPCGVAVNEDFIYWASWADPGYVGRALLKGGARGPNLVELEPSVDYSLCGVAANEEHVFFGGFGDAIGRVGTDGSFPEPRFITGVQSPCSVAIGDGRLYFTEISQWWNGLGHISRSNLDGTEMERELTVGLRSPCGIAVDSLSFGPAYIAAPPLLPWTPCKIDEVKVNKWNGSALVRLTKPVNGDFGVTTRGLHWRVLPRRPSNRGVSPWWMRIRPAARGPAADRLRARLQRKGRAPIKLRIACSEEGSVTNRSAKRLVLHQRMDRPRLHGRGAGPTG